MFESPIGDPYMHQRVVEQVAVAVGRVLQLLEEVRHHADVVPVDLREVHDPIFALAVVRRRVERRSLTPLSGYARLEPSRAILNEKTRVMSAANASTCRSNISFTCSSNESGTPTGASGSWRGSPLALCASTR